jgi:hypothetical protein
MRPYGLFVLLLAPQLGWAMDFSISAGSESFMWEEYDTNNSKLLDESGLRHFVAFDAASWLDRHWQSDFGGRVYSGTVDYDGQTQTGTKVPSDTDYNGIQFEAGFSYYPGNQNPFVTNTGRSGIRMAVGVDSWRRNIQDTQYETTTGTIVSVDGYVENYTTTYGRIAAHYGGGGRWSFNLGAKYPFATTETVGLEALGYASDVTLHPQGNFSLYANLGLQFSRSWGMQIYYDSYRFAKSDPETVYSPSDGTTYYVWQPESHQDVLGAKFSFTF